MSRPNVLIFMPDQQRADCVGAFGNSVVQTPNIDALAARGVRFTDAYSQHPVCGPSRVSLMTGWYPHVAGHRTLDHLLRPDEPNLLRLLKDGGYQVCMPGHRGDVFAPGVTEASTDVCGFLVAPERPNWQVAFPPDHRMHRGFYFGRQGDEPVLDGDEATVQSALRFLAERGDDQRPWAMWVPLIFPHPPFMVEDPWFSLHDRADVPLPIDATTARGKPAFMAPYRDIYGWGDLDEADFREIIATYYGMVSRTDDQLGRIVGAIERQGELDDTIIVYLTDHGEYLGDYGLVEKWPSGLDSSLVRNPLIIAGPGVAEAAACRSLVELVDVLPTILDLAQIEPSHTHFGRSLVHVLRDPSAPHRDLAFSEGGFATRDAHLLERPGWLYEPKGRLQHEQPQLVGTAISVRNSTHTYVYRAYESDELYDRATDPSETINRIDDPDLTAVGTRLRDHILEWLVDTTDVIPWSKDPRFPDLHHGWRT